MRILIENRIDLRRGPRALPRQSMCRKVEGWNERWGRRCWTVLGLVFAVGLPAAYLAGYLDIRQIGIGWILAAIAFGVIYGFGVYIDLHLFFNRRKKWKDARSHVGDELIEYLEITDDGIKIGVRGWHRNRFAYSNIVSYTEGPRFVISLGLERLPLPLAMIGEPLARHIEWLCHHADSGYKDVCHKCRYDLHGSPGPKCPECGAAIRIDESVAGPQPNVVIHLVNGERVDHA